MTRVLPSWDSKGQATKSVSRLCRPRMRKRHLRSDESAHAVLRSSGSLRRDGAKGANHHVETRL
jgi:hypothetical protein